MQELAHEFRERASQGRLRDAIRVLARSQTSLRSAADDLKAVHRLDLPRLFLCFGEETDLFINVEQLAPWMLEVVEMLDRTRKGLAAERGRGGPLSLSTVIYGEALRAFVEDCRIVFREFRGGADLKAGIKKPFGQFCWAIYEHATGGESPPKSYLAKILGATPLTQPKIIRAREM